MNTKHLSLALNFLSLDRAFSFGQIKKSLRIELLDVVYRLLIGLILVSTTLFSLIQLARAYKDALIFSENSVVFEVIGFGLIAISSVLALYLLFRKTNFRIGLSQAIKHEATPLFDLQPMIASFADGFKKGLHKPKITEPLRIHDDF